MNITQQKQTKENKPKKKNTMSSLTTNSNENQNPNVSGSRYGVLTYESQGDGGLSDGDSSGDEMQEDENDHEKYIAMRQVGGKADTLKDAQPGVKKVMPFVPQQMWLEMFEKLPIEIQKYLIKRLNNSTQRFSEQYMSAKGYLDQNEHGKNAVLAEAEELFEQASNKIPEPSKAVVRDFIKGILDVTIYPVGPNGERSVDEETYASVIQGVVLLIDALEKLVTFRNVEHAMYEFKKIIKSYEKSKHQKKIDSVQKLIDGFNDDVDHWKTKKALSQDKDEKEILNKKIANAEKEISTLENKISALKEREQLRRSARLKASPRVTGRKSPTPNDGSGGDPKRQRLQSIAENGSSSSGKPENDDVPL